ncbi:hypothetical protein EDC56_2844 [Sinobacterium caligoides]|uniref:Uncharacterized protein n=1 Tax=Sinobacterium caligoides TaxID=933926 RepID=A0A3N2DK81_9GAMM|nr:hypothetical protein [Sinobacterium caligoides]ROS00206.1 hypothetical protein EDC56_2844 [Sinobacterium caligoides]
MKIALPDLEEQKRMVFEQSTQEAIATLKSNLKAPTSPALTELDENEFSSKHLLREREGWEAPAPEIVRAYFKQFQDIFADYNTDNKLADLLGLSGNRRIREFKQGTRKVPYNVWRHFLVLTGRVPQDVITVMGYL